MHQPIGMDNVWGTKFWEDRVFTLLFYVNKINTHKLHHHFKECPEILILDFRFELAFKMILNELPGSILKPEEFKKSKRSGEDCGNECVSIPKL